MPEIIKDGAIVDDQWQVISDTSIASVDALPAGDLILPLSVWQALSAQLTGRTIGVWLNSDELPEALKNDCAQLPLIAVNFPVFSDGRGYSYAHILRAQYNYQGELRAIGDVLMDQLFFMKRSGFNSYAMREDQPLHEALNHLKDFTHPYQAAIDEKQPLFQRR